ncbi:MAG: ORF6N domain-containing protein [Verrucomicrobia bacterium]|nr:ORF6N domain-containing protein [Verrucomicrobiota bacterium]
MPAVSPAPSVANLIPAGRIESRVLLIRGEKVLIDSALAELYGVTTKVLNQAVRRNIERFPADFMFQLSESEADFLLKSQIVTSKLKSEINSLPDNDILRSQIVTSKRAGGGGRRYLPHAFTEQGVAMLSSVLRSPRAIAVNIEIMRAFVRLRQMIASHADLARKLAALERKYDAQFKAVFDAIRELMTPPAPAKKGEIGFHTLLKPGSASPAAKPANRKSKI